ncbi:MAG: S-layer homology domain-containing protein [Lachnospiraceae bacterium]|nr:S-layer homology domain-containing protein [Lachnospiraceae bacterium]
MVKRWMRIALATGLTGVMVAGGAANAFADASYSSTTGGQNALSTSGTYDGITVTKTGDSNDENADFTGTNAAVLAASGKTITIKNSTITTNGSHANAVFAYGGTVNISDSRITTTGNNSGGIMTTGGGTMNASDLTINTSGNSSAAIRSDRGGGTVTVDGGTYTTTGVGSPSIYSTANITVKNATLSTSKAEAVVIEGGNSVDLENCTVTGDNTTKNGLAQTYQNVMLYQSMSGDASEGGSTFTMNGGTMTAKNGSMFYVTNTSSVINLMDAVLKLSDDNVLLDAAAGPWGNSGSNGGQVTMNAKNQTLTGDIAVDASSAVNLLLSDGSTYTGTINARNTDGKVYVEVPEGTTWTLTGDSYVTSLTCTAGSINLNGHKLYVNGKEYTSGTASTGSSVTKTSTSSSSSSGNTQNGNSQQPQGMPGSTTTSSFTDVKSSAYYDNAVNWAVGRKITSGTSSTTFSPTTGCTRAQIVTFLYNYFNNQNQAPAMPSGGANNSSTGTDSSSTQQPPAMPSGNTDSSSGTGSSSTQQPPAMPSGSTDGSSAGTESSSTQQPPAMPSGNTDSNSTGTDATSGATKSDTTTDTTSATTKFTDVSSDAYYAKAVAWAVENGITAGTSDTTFSPNKTCTRAEAVTFLMRAARLASTSTTTSTTSATSFTDVKTGSYYAEAVAWASANGITFGTSTTKFSPSSTVTRAQVVSFLYRLDEKMRPAQPNGTVSGNNMTPPDQNQTNTSSAA